MGKSESDLCQSETYRNKFVEADFFVFVRVSGDEGLDDFSHFVAGQVEAGFSEQLLELEVAHIAAMVNIWTKKQKKKKPCIDKHHNGLPVLIYNFLLTPQSFPNRNDTIIKNVWWYSLS